MWTEEEEAEIKFLYVEEEQKNVHILASHFDKGYRSIISKLVQLDIYEKPVSTEIVLPSVKSMLGKIEEVLEIEIEGANLNKKRNLYKLMNALLEKLNT